MLAEIEPWVVELLILAVAGLASLPLWRGRRAVAGTTLTAPWAWAMISWCALVAVFYAGAYPVELSDAQWLHSIYFAAATTTFCPGMAVLGAKRPQHVAWQWIVLSLWVVLALPAAQWQWLGAEPSLHPARQWFFMALIALGVVNYLPTRHAAAALLFGFGQWLLLSAYLPWGGHPQGARGAMGMPVIVLALIASWRPRKPPASQDPLDRLWRDFCDAYGLLWGLRVAERFNAQAAKSGLPLRLGWRRFSAAAGQDLTALSPAERQAVTDQLTSWLRRFVDADWIARRLDGKPSR